MQRSEYTFGPIPQPLCALASCHVWLSQAGTFGFMSPEVLATALLRQSDSEAVLQGLPEQAQTFWHMIKGHSRYGTASDVWCVLWVKGAARTPQRGGLVAPAVRSSLPWPTRCLAGLWAPRFTRFCSGTRPTCTQTTRR